MATQLTKTITILLSEDQHRQLTSLAAREGVSLGELLRQAALEKYGLVSPEVRLEAVDALADLDLPVGGVRSMKEESVPKPEDLLP